MVTAIWIVYGAVLSIRLGTRGEKHRMEPFGWVLLAIIIAVFAFWEDRDRAATQKATRARFEGFEDHLKVLESVNQDLVAQVRALAALNARALEAGALGTPNELRTRALTLSKNIVEWISARKVDEQTLYASRAYDPNDDQETRSRKWREWSEGLQRFSAETMRSYAEKFQSQTLSIKGEFAAYGIQPSQLGNDLFAHPTNPLGIIDVASELAAMAWKLPTP